MTYEKLEKMKLTFPELKYSVYCHLKDLGFNNVDISKVYGINVRTLMFFVKNHHKILGKIEVS